MGGLIGAITSSGGNIVFNVLSCLVSAAIVIFITMPIHEYAHAFAAARLGDQTARFYGRLKFNPKNHIDPMGAVMILLFGIGWAKPVPVDSRYFKNPKRDMAITAFAGPLSNFIVALISEFLSALFIFLYYLFEMPLFAIYIILFLVTVFQFIAQINISLAIFNLVPIPPLDGSKILAAFLSDRSYYMLMRYERYFSIILFGIIMFSSRFSNVLGTMVMGVYNIFFDFAWLPFEAILKFL